jgi:hypothetical protein
MKAIMPVVQGNDAGQARRAGCMTYRGGCPSEGMVPRQVPLLMRPNDGKGIDDKDMLTNGGYEGAIAMAAVTSFLGHPGHPRVDGIGFGLVQACIGAFRLCNPCGSP